jgi:hypothetical protein
VVCHVVRAAHVERHLQVVVLLQIHRLGARDAGRIVREPDNRRRRDELRCVQDARHLLRVVGERQRRKVGRRVRVCARGALGCGEVVERLRLCTVEVSKWL